MPWPYCVILTEFQSNARRPETGPAMTLVLPTLRECPPMTMMAIKIGFRLSASTLLRKAARPNPEAGQRQPETFISLPAAPASPVASDILAEAEPEFPRTPRPCRAGLCWAETPPPPAHHTSPSHPDCE